MANLILWRHAEAEDESNTGKDSDRLLTKRGQKDALKMAKWLYPHLPANTRVLSSPARRCLETVAALEAVAAADVEREMPLKVEVVEFLSIRNSLQTLIERLVNDNHHETILIIGHQPNLGLLISSLLGIDRDACAVKKGAIWWLRQRVEADARQVYLFSVQSPRLI